MLVVIIIIAFIAFVAYGKISKSMEEKRSNEASKAYWDERGRKEYGCTPDEMIQKIQSSPNVHKLAVEISKRRPVSCGVDNKCAYLTITYEPYVTEEIYFDSLGMSEIPKDNVFRETLTYALAKDPLLSEYEVEWDRDDVFCHLERRKNDDDEKPKPELECTW